ncbi:xanthine dehydrogenase molybdopterin binding subunit [Neoroseomonas oryzicola]|uniref:Xanthine dehydrogenase molybdopterin binding subunit n=1 Tax=Neoroseomonas oryzicola TaxID=535904 RepID=A0A9X9WIB1_9PROT|nr:xanthine dehydrogenase molybdopterin binding subunit [Neoroseomonas oryzicola]MBR0660071.1 xanthine dehydrogenase molybdopterin binding subunit [Neoroseomonas oryzicola]NKE18208.1 xanthine dehydrogenase molybdopterin binding subunit [Neoroseomonas oryzicola]
MTTGVPVPHDSALAHCTGAARFADDLPDPPGLLHAALVLSPVAHGVLGAIEAPPGVILVTARDVPGANDVSASGKGGEPLFAEASVQHHGQPIAMVLAETRDAALRAAAAVRCAISPLPALLDMEEAIARESFLMPPQVVAHGDAASAIRAAPLRAEGTFRAGGQEHFYLESQVAIAVPGEDGEIAITSSTQHPTEVQHIAGRVLGMDYNRLPVTCRRMGGGFGGKESNASWIAAAAALGAWRTGWPVKLRLARKADMAATGKRHPFLFRWRAGFDASGRILGLEATLAADGGHSLDLTPGVVFRAITHALNCYDVPAVRITALALRTNTVSHTAFRGFGGPQGVLLMEDVIRGVARGTGLAPEAVRERNFAGGPNDALTPYGQALEGDLIRRVWAECRQDAEWDHRRAEIAAFNATHPFIRRGLGSFALAFGISFGVRHLNQAGALVHVYTDGSIRLNHGGTEMGQGLNIKVAQVVAESFGVPLDRVRITATSTAEVPNTAPTAASTGSDLNGWAAHLAATTIRGRMAEVAGALWEVPAEDVRFAEGRVFVARPGDNRAMGFADLAHRCWMERVSLSATGFYRTPDIHWDPATMTGEPFFYFSYGASVAEVAVDLLTGEHRVLRADLVQDCGRSLNPAVDRGQIEGAFVQGMGWLTCEELVWDAEGRQRTLGPSTYKIPGSRDVPPAFNVRLLQDAPARQDTIFRSKAVGEPPLMLATAVWNAILDATGLDRIDLPATPDRILTALSARGS